MELLCVALHGGSLLQLGSSINVRRRTGNTTKSGVVVPVSLVSLWFTANETRNFPLTACVSAFVCAKAEANVQAVFRGRILGLQRVHVQEQRRGVQVPHVWRQEGDVDQVRNPGLRCVTPTGELGSDKQSGMKFNKLSVFIYCDFKESKVQDSNYAKGCFVMTIFRIGSCCYLHRLLNYLC